jgi:VanZ family protein
MTPSNPPPARRRPAIPRWIWPVALAVGITTVSGQSSMPAPEIINFDKLAHFLVFGLLATLVARVEGVAAWPVLGMGWAVVLVSAFGGLDEWHQGHTPGRYVEVADWVADTLGAALAVTLYARWGWYRRLLEMPVGVRKRRVENPAATVPDTTS